MIIQVFAETDEEAPDSWTGGVPATECPYRERVGFRDIECLMMYSDPLELVAHMQTFHQGPLDDDLDAHPDVDLDPYPF